MLDCRPISPYVLVMKGLNLGGGLERFGIVGVVNKNDIFHESNVVAALFGSLSSGPV